MEGHSYNAGFQDEIEAHPFNNLPLSQLSSFHFYDHQNNTTPNETPGSNNDDFSADKSYNDDLNNETLLINIFHEIYILNIILEYLQHTKKTSTLEQFK